ncbi:MAG: Abi family protein [Bacteroidales bacterium]|nr:Abi family protein [Bacteroidales bacterium]
MKYPDYENAFSAARLNRFLKACRGDKVSALTLYRHNVKLCQKFYGVLNIFEVVLRNAINEHYKIYFSDSNWIRHQIVPGGMLENHPQRIFVEKCIVELDKANRYTNDRIVSSVTFGFWTHLFSRQPFALGGQSILHIFPGKTKGLGQRAIYNELQSIKDFRNRIAHHEAICFDGTGAKNTQPAKDNYALVIKYIQFLGYPESHLYYGLDVLPDKIIEKIDAL